MASCCDDPSVENAVEREGAPGLSPIKAFYAGVHRLS